MLSFTVTVPPAVEPVSLALAKLHCKIDFPDDDLLVTAFIVAARQWAEIYCGRAFYSQTIVLSLDAFPLWLGGSTILPSQQRGYPMWSAYYEPLAIRLPRPICQSVTSITYRDLTNTVQTLDPSTYYVDTTSEPARIVPMPSFTWPTSQAYLPGSVQVTYVAGSYGDGVTVNSIPQTIVAAMLLYIAHLYEHREAASELALKNIPLGVMALLDTVRFVQFTFDSGV